MVCRDIKDQSHATGGEKGKAEQIINIFLVYSTKYKKLQRHLEARDALTDQHDSIKFEDKVAASQKEQIPGPGILCKFLAPKPRKPK